MPNGDTPVYIGGGRSNSCSVLEAIELSERVTGTQMAFGVDLAPKRGDHRWWITDLHQFQQAYPGWRLTYDLERAVREIYEADVDYLQAAG